MPCQKTHRTLRAQAPRADEIPVGQPAPPAASNGPVKRRRNGQVADAESARALAKRASGVRKGRAVLAESLQLEWMSKIDSAKPFVKLARSFARAQCQQIAQTVGGGMCGPAAMSLVHSAALQLAASRWMFSHPLVSKEGGPTELGQRLTTASRLADASRQNLLSAYELAAREATARTSSGAPRLDIGSIDVSAELAALMDAGSAAQRGTPTSHDEDTDDDE